ncbi:hypothetical protein N7517_003900 [Penicillium concentricum]|uniref:Uncharacterized protein n=1 Tax=Penicillium concentricum TaxID=293559 RepID=A0A9W9S6L5_9EURO|nr:uncharacterized protein N7517_003900 [Penicillium concentricum]KAJ5371894.1 hypothetical protein N7517_003900 [Penicillium concentricum]
MDFTLGKSESYRTDQPSARRDFSTSNRAPYTEASFTTNCVEGNGTASQTPTPKNYSRRPQLADPESQT